MSVLRHQSRDAKVRTLRSNVFDLSASAAAHVLYQDNLRDTAIESAEGVYVTEDASANTGIRVAIGHATDTAPGGTPTFDDDSVGSLTTTASAKKYTHEAFTIASTLKTSNRAPGFAILPKGCPLIATSDGSKTGAGELQVVVRYWPLDRADKLTQK